VNGLSILPRGGRVILFHTFPLRKRVSKIVVVILRAKEKYFIEDIYIRLGLRY
jgi:hypothetical protein